MSNNGPIKALVFDLDGTLFDTLPSLADAANMVLRRMGLKEVPTHLLRTPLSQGLGPMFSYALALQPDELDLAVSQTLTEQFFSIYADQFLPQAQLYAGVTELMARMQSQGLSLAVCTNRDRASAQALLTASPLAPYFATIVGRGDAPQPKPAPDLLLYTLHLLDLPPSHVVFVGDSWLDARCAELAQVRFAAYLGGYAAKFETLQPCVLRFAHYAQLADWVQAVTQANEHA